MHSYVEDYEEEDPAETHYRHRSNGRSPQSCPCKVCAGLRKAVAIPGITIVTAGERAGHEARQEGIGHIEEMQASGYLDGGEAAARIGYIRAAKTHEEIRALTADLPPPPDRRSLPRRVVEDFDEPAHYVPVLTALAAAGGVLAIAPSVIAADHGWWLTLHGYLTAIPCIILGAALFVSSVCAAISKAVE